MDSRTCTQSIFDLSSKVRDIFERNDDPNRRVYDTNRKIAFIMNLMNYHRHIIRLRLYP